MKKIFTLILFAGSMAVANAQITTGFYHVKNATTGRCLVMTDNTKGATDTQKGSTIDFGAVETNRNAEYVSTHPGAVCYIISKGGNKYDVAAQGTSIAALTGNAIYPILEKQSDGTYTIRGQYSSFNIMLGDLSNKDRSTGEYKDDGKLTQVSDLERGTWEVLPIGTSASGEFIGIKPEVQTADGTWWGTFFAGFAFKLHSTGMKAYYVDAVNDTEFSLKEITGTVPAGTAIIIQCASDDYTQNIISPETSSADAIANHLGAVYFDRTDANHKNATAYNKNTMRVLGVDENKQLVFQVAPESYLKSGAYLPHNKCYLGVSNSAAETLYVKGTTGIHEIQTATDVKTADKEGTYNLNGQRMENEPTAPGVYIQNGKKLIIK